MQSDRGEENMKKLCFVESLSGGLVVWVLVVRAGESRERGVSAAAAGGGDVAGDYIDSAVSAKLSGRGVWRSDVRGDS